jgi:hypothetical protein
MVMQRYNSASSMVHVERVIYMDYEVPVGDEYYPGMTEAEIVAYEKSTPPDRWDIEEALEDSQVNVQFYDKKDD